MSNAGKVLAVEHGHIRKALRGLWRVAIRRYLHVLAQSAKADGSLTVLPSVSSKAANENIMMTIRELLLLLFIFAVWFAAATVTGVGS